VRILLADTSEFVSVFVSWSLIQFLFTITAPGFARYIPLIQANTLLKCPLLFSLVLVWFYHGQPTEGQILFGTFLTPGEQQRSTPVVGVVAAST
jgi:hypothetical protein